jgi:putative hydrolase of the HAD superfamily
MLKLPKIAIFDLDNTLYDYDSANYFGKLALIDYLSENLSKEPSDISKELERSRIRVKEALGKTASSHSRLLYIRDFLTRNEIFTHATFALECEQVYWRAFLDKSILFEGVMDFISLLRLNRVKTVLITDFTTNIQLRKLSWFNLEKSFDLVITSEEAGGDKITGKPENFLENFISVSGGEVWAIGDMDYDHIFVSESTFFKKVQSKEFKNTEERRYEFSSFLDLISKLN